MLRIKLVRHLDMIVIKNITQKKGNKYVRAIITKKKTPCTTYNKNWFKIQLQI